MKHRAIYTMTMARYLIDNGFEPVAKVPDRRDIKKDVWLFDATPEFNAVFEAYVAGHKKNVTLDAGKEV